MKTKQKLDALIIILLTFNKINEHFSNVWAEMFAGRPLPDKKLSYPALQNYSALLEPNLELNPASKHRY